MLFPAPFRAELSSRDDEDSNASSHLSTLAWFLDQRSIKLNTSVVERAETTAENLKNVSDVFREQTSEEKNTQLCPYYHHPKDIQKNFKSYVHGRNVSEL